MINQFKYKVEIEYPVNVDVWWFSVDCETLQEIFVAASE